MILDSLSALNKPVGGTKEADFLNALLEKVLLDVNLSCLQNMSIIRAYNLIQDREAVQIQVLKPFKSAYLCAQKLK